MGYEYKKRPVDSRTSAADGVPDMQFDRWRIGISDTTAASTALEPGQVYGLTSTNTATTPKVWTVEDPAMGDILGVHIKSIATTSSPMHVNLGNGVLVDSSQDMIVLSSAPAGAWLVALSSTKWGLLGAAGGASFATST